MGGRGFEPPRPDHAFRLQSTAVPAGTVRWIVCPPLARPKYGTGMPPLPRITGREIVRAVNHLGWVLVVQKGSHAQLKHPERGGGAPPPLSAGERHAGLPCPAKYFRKPASAQTSSALLCERMTA